MTKVRVWWTLTVSLIGLSDSQLDFNKGHYTSFDLRDIRINKVANTNISVSNLVFFQVLRQCGHFYIGNFYLYTRLEAEIFT